jgi:hypothetical protein
MSSDSEDSEPTHDPNDLDFAPSPRLILTIRRPRARLSEGVLVEDNTRAAAYTLAPPAPSEAPHASQVTVLDMASAKKELLSKMSAQGHQPFIRCDLW